MTNTAASVNAKLREISRRSGEDMMTLQTRYVLERLLWRMCQTQWKDDIALKGALIFVVYEGDIHRPTGDMDINGYDENGTIDTLDRIMRDALAVECDDGVVFDLDSMMVRKERSWSQVKGGKVELFAKIDRSEVRVRVDAGFGSAIVPSAKMMEYPSIIKDMPSACLKIYPFSTMISEKIHALVQHGAESSRLRDYYDIWSLSERYEFQGPILGEAIRSSFARFGTNLPALPLDGLSEDFVDMRTDAWEKFRTSKGLRFKAPNLEETVSKVRLFVEQAVISAHGDDIGDWNPKKGWSHLENTTGMTI